MGFGWAVKAELPGARVAKRMGQDGDAQWPKSGYKNWVYSAARRKLHVKAPPQ